MGVIFSKTSGVNDSIFGKSEAPIRAYIEEKAEAYEQKSVVKNIFVEVDSDNFAEKFTGLTSMANGFQPVGEGGALPLDERQEGYSKTIYHETWKDSFSITREMVDDGKLGDLNRIGANGFIKAFYSGQEEYGATILAGAIAGTSTTYKGKTVDCTSADGESLFSTAHTSITGNTANQSNKFAGAFSVDVLSAIETRMQNFVDDNGKVLTIAPDTIIIPNDAKLKKEVFAAIGADKDRATSNNGFNYQFGRWNVIVWPNFKPSGSDKPFILLDSANNEELFGLIKTNRVPLEIGSWIDNNTKNNVWDGYARYELGFNEWRTIAVGGVTGGTALTDQVASRVAALIGSAGGFIPKNDSGIWPSGAATAQGAYAG